jgi:hypothetical protein
MDPLQRQWQTRARGYTPSVFDSLDERLFTAEMLEPHSTSFLLIVEESGKSRHHSLIDFAVAAFYAYARQTEREFAKLSANVAPRPLASSAAAERMVSTTSVILNAERRPTPGDITQALTLLDIPGQSGIAIETRDGYLAVFAEI